MYRSWLTVKEAAEYEKCSERKIQLDINAGKIEHREVPAKNRSRGGFEYEIHRDSLSPEAKYRMMMKEAPPEKISGGALDYWPDWKVQKAMGNYNIVIEAKTISGRNKTERKRQLAAKHGISLATLHKLVKGFDADGFEALAPNYGKTRGHSFTMSPELMEFIRADYLRPEKPFKEHVYHDVKAYCSVNKINLPSYRTVCRFLQSLDDADVTLFRDGRKAWSQKYEPVARRSFDDLAVNEIWCLDHRELDLFVYTNDKKIAYKRPWISAQMDLRSRCLVGWHISFQPNSQTIALGLRHGILNYGKPEKLYLDNGKDYRSRYLNGKTKKVGKIDLNLETKGVFGRLDIQTIYAWPYNARSKPIEPFFNNFPKQFERYLPGWCGQDNKARPEKLNKEIANGELLTIDELMHLISKFVQEYNNRVHSELGQSPNQIYSEAFHITKVDPDSLVLMMLKREQRTYFNDGIHLFGVRYRSRELNAQVKVGQAVDVYYDPANLDHISVFRDNRFICHVPIESNMSMNASEDDFKRMAQLRKEAKAQIKKERQNWTFAYSKEAAMKEVQKFRDSKNEPGEPIVTPAAAKPGKVVALFGEEFKNLTRENEPAPTRDKEKPMLLMGKYKPEEQQEEKVLLIYGNK